MYISPTPTPPKQQVSKSDSLTHLEKKVESISSSASPQISAEQIDSQQVGKFGKYFSHFGSGSEQVFHIETDLISADFTSKGGMLKKWELKKFTDWGKKNLVQLIENINDGDFSLLFSTTDGKIINTSDLYFSPNSKFNSITVSNNNEFTLDYILQISETKKLIRRYVFKNDEYGFRAENIFVEMQNIISGEEYQLVWEHGLHLTEYNSVDEAGFAKALAFTGGEEKEIDAAKVSETPKSDFSGTTDWVATNNKYFGIALIAKEPKAVGGFLHGVHLALDNHGVKEIYKVALKLPFKGTREEKTAVTVLSAAVADFSPVVVARQKIKKGK